MEEALRNVCHVDKKVLRRTIHRLLRPRRILLLGFAGLFLLVWGAYLLLVPQPRNLGIVIGLPALAAVYGLLALLGTRQNLRIVMKRLQENRQVKEYDCAVEFGPEELSLRVSYSDDLLRLPYKSLRRVLETKDLLILTTKARLSYPLDPVRFVNGSQEDFWRLMKEKCPKALPKKRRVG